jgi:hypothetical protein
MRPRTPAALGLLLVAAASLQWGSLAFPNTPAIYAPLWLEAAGLALAAWGVLRAEHRAAAAGLGVAALAQVAFYVTFAAGGLGLEGSLSSTFTALGYGLAAWGLARTGTLADARAGFAVATMSMVAFAALDLASGSTLLLAGYVMAIPGWLLATAAASGVVGATPARPAHA